MENLTKRVYIRDIEKTKIIKVYKGMRFLVANLKDKTILKNEEAVEKMRKIIIETYANSKCKEGPEITVEFAEKLGENGFEIDIERTKMDWVVESVIEMKTNNLMPPDMLAVKEKAEEDFLDFEILGEIYDYLENSLKKVIVSELFKRICDKNKKSGFTVKVSAETLDNIFLENNIFLREAFFCDQFETWCIYNGISTFKTFNIKSRESDKKYEIFIHIDIASKLLSFR